MTISLNTYANKDTNYVAKLNQDNNALETAINGILASLGTGVTEGPFLNAIFGTSTAFIGASSYTQSTASTTLTISSGYAWRPDLGSVLYKGSSTAINFSGQPAATYYIEIGADGTPSSLSSSSFPMYSVVWTGSAFGTITMLAPVVPNGDVSGNLQTLTIVAKAVTLAKMADLAANSVIGNATGSSGTPTAIPLGSANGVATLDSGGKVPSSQLPSAVVGGVDYQGTWDASANSPALASGVGTKGYYYKVSVAGSTTIDSNTNWHVGDWIVFDGTVWEKIDNYEAVTSVATLVGAITASALTAALNTFTSSLQGLVPASGGGTTTYLRADGVFAAVAGASGGTVTSVQASVPNDFVESGGPVTSTGTLSIAHGALKTVSAAAGASNDVNPDAAWPVGFDRVDVTLGSGAANWTGLVAGGDGQRVILSNQDSANNLTLNSQNAGSTAANRFSGPDDIVVVPGQSLMLVYYAGSVNRWRIVT